MTKLAALVDPQQVMAIGYALLLAGNTFKDKLLSPSDLADAVDQMMEKEGLAVLSRHEDSPVFFARPRRLELAGAINRLRNLKVAIVDPQGR